MTVGSGRAGIVPRGVSDIPAHITGTVWKVEVAVGDEVLAVAPEEQGVLFQPFVRATATNEQVGGTGLGLYIVRQIVEAHGGSVALESAVGQGTTVTVRLPLAVPGGAADGMAPATP